MVARVSEGIVQPNTCLVDYILAMDGGELFLVAGEEPRTLAKAGQEECGDKQCARSWPRWRRTTLGRSSLLHLITPDGHEMGIQGEE